MKLSAIAAALEVRLENGSPETEISGLNGIEQAGPAELTFVSNPKYAGAAQTTRAAAVIVGNVDNTGMGSNLYSTLTSNSVTWTSTTPPELSCRTWAMTNCQPPGESSRRARS